MITLHPQYIEDTAGQKLVVLSQIEFDALLEELEEVEDIRLYDEAKKDTEPSVPIIEAFEMIEKQRTQGN